MQNININLPQSLYETLKQRAIQSHHTIEDELVQVVAAAVKQTAVYGST